MIRDLTEADTEVYIHLRQESFRKAPLSFDHNPDEVLDAAVVRKQLAAKHAEDFIVGYFLDGRLVGTTGIHRFERRKRSHRALLTTVYVTESARGRGVARQLLRTCLERARKMEGLERIILSVSHRAEGALRMYREAGFEEFGREPGAARSDGTPMDEIHMLLNL